MFQTARSAQFEMESFFGLANGQIAAGNFLAEGAVVGEEALTGLLAQPASANHLAEQRMGTILRVTGLAVQGLHDCQVNVVAN